MKLYQVDSFTSQLFTGNPAGVCIMDNFPATSCMQAIAMEMNLSETAFVEIKNNAYSIRFFTPACEVPLCGHATLAAAHVLREQKRVNNDLVFQSSEGAISVSFCEEEIRMRFPAYRIHPTPNPPQLKDIIGVQPLETYKNQHNNWLVVLVENEQAVLNAKPDFARMEREEFDDIIVTAKSEHSQFDFVVRVFCNPTSGITEDPVTGVANCALIPFWNLKTGKTAFRSKQLSKRGGTMRIELNNNTIDIFGQAVTAFAIEIVSS